MKKLLLFASFAAISAVSYGQTLLSEDFESGAIPATWTVQAYNNAETWHVEPINSFVATVNYDPALNLQDEKLITPSLDFTGGTAFTLKAAIGLSYYWSVDPNNNYDAFIKVSTDDGTTWTQIWSENDLGVFTNWVMNPVVLDLSSYAGNSNVKIAFQYVGTDGAALYLDNVSVTVPPTVAPNCATPTSPANAAAGISYPTTSLAWTAPTTGSAVDSYDVYLDVNANPTTLIGNTTSLTITASALAPSTQYYWKVVPKNAAGSATGCTVFSFTTAANPFAPYCGPLLFPFLEPITRVLFAGIDNVTSAATTGTPAHEDFTSITGNVSQGGSYQIALEGNTDGAWTDRFAVFIDWNQNGILNDAGEVYQITQTLINSTGVDGQQAVQTLTVPANATIGNTRMRVKKIFGTADLIDPCKGASFGQAEDYTINVGVLAVNDNVKNTVRVYPNPVVDVLNIESPNRVKSVSVFDLSGKSVSSQVLNATKSQVNLSKLTPGVYVVNIEMENETKTIKMIKK